MQLFSIWKYWEKLINNRYDKGTSRQLLESFGKKVSTVDILNIPVQQHAVPTIFAGQTVKWKQKCLGNFPTLNFGNIISVHSASGLVHCFPTDPKQNHKFELISFKILSGIEYFGAEQAVYCPFLWEKSQNTPRVMLGEAVSWAEAGEVTLQSKGLRKETQ